MRTCTGRDPVLQAKRQAITALGELHQQLLFLGREVVSIFAVVKVDLLQDYHGLELQPCLMALSVLASRGRERERKKGREGFGFGFGFGWVGTMGWNDKS